MLITDQTKPSKTVQEQNKLSLKSLSHTYFKQSWYKALNTLRKGQQRREKEFPSIIKCIHLEELELTPVSIINMSFMKLTFMSSKWQLGTE